MMDLGYEGMRCSLPRRTMMHNVRTIFFLVPNLGCIFLCVCSVVFSFWSFFVLEFFFLEFTSCACEHLSNSTTVVSTWTQRCRTLIPSSHLPAEQHSTRHKDQSHIPRIDIDFRTDLLCDHHRFHRSTSPRYHQLSQSIRARGAAVRC